MGVPTQAQAHAWTDRLAALAQKDLDGFASVYASGAGSPLYDQIAASVDAEVVTALASYGLAVDRVSLPENMATWIQTILRRSAYASFVTQLQQQVVTYGGYANLRTYAVDKSVVFHPLFAELARLQLGEAAFTDSGGDITTVFAPDYSTLAPERAYTGADGSLTDDTTDAQDVGTADVALFGTDDFCLYAGHTRQFSHLIPGLSTLASATISPTFQYWNGSAWATLAVTDNSAGFTKNDTISWTRPTDWEPCAKDAGGTAFADTTRRYYVRISRTANSLVTPPVATCLRLVPALLQAGTRHLGVPQPPLALIRITGAATLVVEPIAAVDFARFIEPALRFRALTPLGVSPVLTLAYTNQAGADVTQAQSAWTTPAALDTRAVTLNGTDTGARAVLAAGNAVSSGAQGVIEVYSSAQETLSRTPAL